MKIMCRTRGSLRAHDLWSKMAYAGKADADRIGLEMETGLALILVCTSLHMLSCDHTMLLSSAMGARIATDMRLSAQEHFVHTGVCPVQEHRCRAQQQARCALLGANLSSNSRPEGPG